MTKNIFIHTLQQRGLIAQISHAEELNQILQKSHVNSEEISYSIYCGFDPTAASLHIGNLVSLLILRRAQDCGLRPIILFGGATGLIGDPTGRTEMRPMHSKEQIAEYIENFKNLVQRYFNFDLPNKPIIVNNIDWIGEMSWLNFARNIGRHFTVARLLSAEVNKSRLQQGGLTFMELGYQLLQSYDFFHLYQNYNCIMQVGGDDQWSNILGGADLIRRLSQGKAFAITTPLLVAQNGEKFGKSAGNAIWLDSKLTSVYEFFQFFRNIHDADIEKMLRTFTLLSLEEIALLLTKPDINEIKEIMALEITKLVHGADAAQQALDASHALFSNNVNNLAATPSTQISKKQVQTGIDILVLLLLCKLVSSRGEGKKLIQANGLQFNGATLTDSTKKIDFADFQNEEQIILLRKGKKNFHIVRWCNQEDSNF